MVLLHRRRNAKEVDPTVVTPKVRAKVSHRLLGRGDQPALITNNVEAKMVLDGAVQLNGKREVQIALPMPPKLKEVAAMQLNGKATGSNRSKAAIELNLTHHR